MVSNLLNIEQAAAITGYSKGYIYNMVHRREIPHLKGKRFLRFDESTLRAWMADHYVNVPTHEQLADEAAAYVIKNSKTQRK